MREDNNSLDFFVGGVPPDTFFNLSFKDICAIVQSSSEKNLGSNTTAEVCLIGLAAHFEAFCKNQFAAIVNICPQVLSQFCERRDGLTVEVRALLAVIPAVDQNLGFLLAEQFDFGSPKKINALFHDLLNITPFSKQDGNKYARFLVDRNLLVHHGGIYTLKYERQTFTRQAQAGSTRVHFDSLAIRRKDFDAWAQFLVNTAKKISRTSYQALRKFVAAHQVLLAPSRRQALETFLRLAWTA
jgi:hypothetical protein